MGRPRGDVATRFAVKVHKREPDECWEWLARCDHDGYGTFKLDGKTVKASRIAWELGCGRIPDGMCVLHRCDNPPCCNPAHLFLGTHADNAADKVAKGRNPDQRGQAHHRARLTDEQVLEIVTRARAGETQRRIASDFGVAFTHVNNILSGHRWSHLTGIRRESAP